MPEAFSLPNLLARCGVSKRFMNADLSEFSAYCQKIGKTGESLFAHGPRGTGKTHFLCACLSMAVQKKLKAGELNIESLVTTQKPPVKFLPAPELLLEFKQSYEPNSPMSEADILKKYSAVDLLVLDDLGVERVSHWSIQVLYLLIDRRYRDMKATMISSNLRPSEIAAKFDDRIASRICEMCHQVKFSASLCGTQACEVIGGFSQRQTAKEIGVSQPRVRAIILKAENPFSLLTLPRRITTILGGRSA